MKGKEIIQELCHGSFQWDVQIPDEIKFQWMKWKNKFSLLSDIKITRCCKSREFGKVIEYSLHHFSDASEGGYGQASYLRLVNKKRKIHCVLVIGKTCVTPLKFFPIPRLKLTPEVFSVKVSKQFQQELKIESYNGKIEEIFWTDSQVVLHYINNESKWFEVFVPHHIQIIIYNKSTTTVALCKIKGQPSR